jgi:23S rRNA (adenine1618-N6)-methyltransferase
MFQEKREHPKEKFELHPRNKHRARYDFPKLIADCPELVPFVSVNAYNDESINFFDPEAVKMLNTALLKHFYGVSFWDIPADYLCPPIPGRADYVHYIADVLAQSNQGQVPRKLQCLDIGVGSNCVYPIIGAAEYDWSFVGTDIDAVAIESAANIAQNNAFLSKKATFRLQNNPKNIFKNIIAEQERFDLAICNPPFHASAAEANASTQRKLTNLRAPKTDKPVLNFGGKNHELWCEGGEATFVRNMIRESKIYGHYCFCFSTLISKQVNLDEAYDTLVAAKASTIEVIPMGQGNKISRILVWSFLPEAAQKDWVKERWGK